MTVARRQPFPSATRFTAGSVFDVAASWGFRAIVASIALLAVAFALPQLQALAQLGILAAEISLLLSAVATCTVVPAARTNSRRRLMRFALLLIPTIAIGWGAVVANTRAMRSRQTSFVVARNVLQSGTDDPTSALSKANALSAESAFLGLVPYLRKSADFAAFEALFLSYDESERRKATLLTLLSWPEAVHVLAGAGVDFNQRDGEGASWVHVAALGGPRTLLEVVAHGGDADAQDSAGRTPVERITLKLKTEGAQEADVENRWRELRAAIEQGLAMRKSRSQK